MGAREKILGFSDIASLKRLENYVGDDAKKLRMCAVLFMLATIAVSFVPFGCGKFLNGMLDATFNDSDKSAPAMMFLSIAILLGIWAITASYSAKRATVISLGVTRRMRRDLNRKMMSIPVERLDDMTRGSFIPMVSTGIPAIGRMLSSDYIGLFAQTTMVAIVAFMMLLTSPRLFITYLIVLPVSALASNFLTRMSSGDFKDQRELVEDFNTRMSDIVSGQRTIKAERMEEETLEEFRESNRSFTDAYVRSRTRSGMLGPLTWMAANLGYVFTIMNGAVLMSKGILEPGMFISFMIYVRMINKPLLMMSSLYDALRSEADSLRVLMDFLESDDEAEGKEFRTEGERGSVEFEDVTFGYEEGRPVLESLSFSVEPGSVTAIIGRTGSGKSTLAALLLGFYRPWSGRVLLDGADVGGMSRGMLRSRVAIVLQDPWVFEGTIRDNVVYNREVSPERLDAVADITGLAAYVESLPDGYDTVIGNDVMRVPLAQRRMISMARALLGDPEVVVLDEAFAGMDPVTGGKALEGVREAMAGRTVIMITHNPAVIDAADAVVRL